MCLLSDTAKKLYLCRSYPHVTQNVDFKHPFYLVVLSREEVSSCNHTSIVHQDSHIPNILLHLLERGKKPKLCLSFREKKPRYARVGKMSRNYFNP